MAMGTYFGMFGGIQVHPSIPMEQVGDMDVSSICFGVFGVPQVFHGYG